MMDTVWKKFSAQRPKGKKLYVFIGILSGSIWILSIVAVLALKDKGVAKALVAAAGAKSDTLNIHGLNVNVNVNDREASEAVPEHPGQDQAHQEKDQSEATATLTVDVPTRAEWEALKELAELHAKAGDLEQSVQPLERILVMPTRDADLLTLATKVFLGTGHYREALQTAEQAIVIRPQDLALKAQAIEATYRLGKVEKAYTTGQSEVAAHPNDLTLLVQLATMEVEIGPAQPDYGKSLQAALKLDPNYEPALYLLGRKCQLEGNYKDAENAFQAVLKLNPANSKAHGQLGIALYHQKKLPEAQSAFETELALAPSDYNTWFNLGELHLTKAGMEIDPEKIKPQREMAMNCFLKALEFNANHAQAAFRVGVLLNGNGQYKEAIHYLESSLQLDARYVPTLVQLALSYEYLKRPERAKHYLTLANELDPLNKVVLFKLKQWS